MAESFLGLDRDARAEILPTLAAKLGRAPAVLEKDVWVCWTLSALCLSPVLASASRAAHDACPSLSRGGRHHGGADDRRGDAPAALDPPPLAHVDCPPVHRRARLSQAADGEYATHGIGVRSGVDGTGRARVHSRHRLRANAEVRGELRAPGRGPLLGYVDPGLQQRKLGLQSLERARALRQRPALRSLGWRLPNLHRRL